MVPLLDAMLSETTLIAVLKIRIKAARERAGLTQQQLADSLGWTVVHLQRFEGLHHARKINPTISTLVQLCSALDINLDELFRAPSEAELSALDTQIENRHARATQ
jgi:transcriptional regulator with XRE-family HTH domain